MPATKSDLACCRSQRLRYVSFDLRRDRACAVLSYLAVRRAALGTLSDRLQAYVRFGYEMAKCGKQNENRLGDLGPRLLEKPIDQARKRIETLSHTQWPSRFNDVQGRIEKRTAQLSSNGPEYLP